MNQRKALTPSRLKSFFRHSSLPQAKERQSSFHHIRLLKWSALQTAFAEPRLAFNRIVLLRYRSHLESRQLAPGTINLRLGAVRRLAYEAADCGLLSADLAAGIR